MSKLAIAIVTLADLEMKSGTQFRAALDDEAVKDYTLRLKEWKEANTTDKEGKPLAKIPPMSEWTKCPLPPITVFETADSGTINADGFHRVKAAKAAGLEDFPAEVRSGTKEEAIRFALKANNDHGVRLTNADLHNKLKAALKIEKLKALSNNALAKEIGTSEGFVRLNRPAGAAPAVRTAVGKDGKETKVDTSRIGKKGGKKAKPAKKAAKKGAEKKSGQGMTEEERALAGIGGDSSTDPKKFDADTETALKRVLKSVGEPAGVVPALTDGGKLEEAIRSGAVDISAKDLRELSKSTPERIRQVYPLVFGEKRMKPAHAFAFVDKEPDENMKLGHLFNLATANGGLLKEYAGADGFHIFIAAKDSVKLIENKALKSYFLCPVANEKEALAAIKEA